MTMSNSALKLQKSNDSVDLPWDMEVDSFIKNITKNVLRMQIFLLLYIHRELYVTQISNKLNKNKATVSRHLNAMEKEGVLEAKELSDNRNLKRKYYRLSLKKFYAILPKSLSYQINEELLHSDKRLKLFAKFIEIFKSLKTLVSKGFDVVEPMIDTLEKKLKNLDTANEEFIRLTSFIFPERMLHFEPVLISKERVTEANELYKEYISKLREIRAKGIENKEENSILMFHMMVPLKDILESDAIKTHDE